jgi:hypothetical protein
MPCPTRSTRRLCRTCPRRPSSRFRSRGRDSCVL